MRTLNMFQGSKEWYAERSRRFTASEAPAMMGASKYQSRDELLYQKATGIVPEVTEAKQALFDRGHRAEAAARRIVEDMLGQDLYPVTAVSDEDDRLLASLDGCTIDEATLYEHKLWSEGLAAQVRARDLEPHYYWQLEQQLLVAGAEKVIFVCSDGTPEKFASMAYRPVPGRADALRAGWDQFAADLAAYVPPAAAAPTATGRAPDALPALRIEVTGHVTASNLVEFREHALAVIAGINRDLQTDADFANAEQTVKWCASAEARLKAAKDAALAQTASIEEAFRVIDDVSAELRRTRLDLDKSVKAEKDNRRAEKVMAARSEFDKHVARLQLDIKGVRLIVPAPDFGGAIKGMSSIASIDDKLTAALIEGKANANTVAGRVMNNLQSLDSVPQFAHLFADRQELAYKDAETLELLMQKRVDAEAARLEAERQRIQAEAERKAKEAAERQSVQPTALHGPHGTVAYQADGMPAEGRAKFDHDPRFAAVVAGAPAPQVDEPATLKLRSINERLAAFALTEAGIRSLGIEPAGQDKRAVLYSESQFADLCDAIARRAMEAKRAALLPA